jgi:hypothetical protein
MTTTPHTASTTLNRRHALAMGAGALAIGLGWALSARAAQPKPLVEVWKDPNCGCCKDWMAHLEGAGFEVKAHDKGNTAARAAFGMPQALGSCHTAKVQGYVIEGHVPAADIKRLLADKPQALGLAVPGMPIGSPGMDGPAYGGKRDPYKVLLVQKNGSSQVFASYV